MMSGGKKSRSSPVPDEKLLPETAEPVQADQDEPSTMPNAKLWRRVRTIRKQINIIRGHNQPAMHRRLRTLHVLQPQDLFLPKYILGAKKFLNLKASGQVVASNEEQCGFACGKKKPAILSTGPPDRRKVNA